MTGQLAPGGGKIIFLADIHNVCIVGSTTWGTRSKWSIISIEMYIKWAWYIERMYTRRTPHSLELKMNMAIVEKLASVGHAYRPHPLLHICFLSYAYMLSARAQISKLK